MMDFVESTNWARPTLPARYELRQEQPLGTDAENNWFSMQSALKAHAVLNLIGCSWVCSFATALEAAICGV